MIKKEETDQIKNEVLRKIGRNLMLFQQLEHLIKHLVITAEQTITLKDKETSLKQRKQYFHKKTMGMIAGKFFADYYTILGKNEKLPTEMPDNSISIELGTECEEEHHVERRNKLSLLVNDRNDLIHHLLPKWNMSDPESSMEIEGYLDKQREKILPEIEFFKEKIRSRNDIRKQLAEYLLSDKAKRELFSTVPPLLETKLVVRLWNIAKQSSSLDGWVLLSTAANTIYNQAPQEFIYVKEQYGFKKLKEVFFATEEYFDVGEEIMDNGGKRMFYRIKPELLNLSIS